MVEVDTPDLYVKARAKLSWYQSVLKGEEPDNATSPTFLPLYEGKMIHHFDHRFATYEESGRIRDVTAEEHSDPTFAPMPRYWVEDSEVEERLVKRDSDGNVTWKWTAPWLLGFRDIARSTDERTAIFSLIPRVAAGNNLPLLFPAVGGIEASLVLLAATSSLIFDFLARQAVGGSHLNFYILRQLPLPTPQAFGTDEFRWIVDRATCLVATDDLVGRAIGLQTRSTIWGQDSRLKFEAELSAYFMYFYGLDEEDVAYVLDSFPVLKRREESSYGQYKTKDIVLSAFRNKPWLVPRGAK